MELHGAGGRETQDLISIWKRNFNLSIIVLQETHFAEDATIQFTWKLGKHWRHECSPSKNASRGIYVVWNAAIMGMEVITKTDQFIILVVDSKGTQLGS